MLHKHISANIAERNSRPASRMDSGVGFVREEKMGVRLNEQEIKAKEDEKLKPEQAIQQQPQVLIIDPSPTNIMRLLMEVDAKLQFLISGLTEKK